MKVGEKAIKRRVGMESGTIKIHSLIEGQWMTHLEIANYVNIEIQQ